MSSTAARGAAGAIFRRLMFRRELGRALTPAELEIRRHLVDQPASGRLEAAGDRAGARAEALADPAAAAGASECSIEEPLAPWIRAPELDRRIRQGDDFAGDAWRHRSSGELRYCVVGHRPEEGRGSNG